MTSQNFPSQGLSHQGLSQTLPSIPTQVDPEDPTTTISEDPNASEASTEFEELAEFTPEARKNRSKSGWHKRPRRQLAGSRGLLIGLGIGVIMTLGAVKIATSADGKSTATDAPAAATSPVAQSVTVAAAKQTTVRDTFSANGTVTADHLLPIAAATPGLKIQQVLVSEGDPVEAGQPLAILDNSILQAQLNQAQASVQSSQSAVQQKKAALVQAQASLNQAQSNARRYEQLAAQGAVSRQDLETQETTVATASAAVSVAQADIDSAQSDALGKAAQVQQLQTQIGQTEVTAPESGLVAERLAEVGDVTGSDKLFSIIQNGSLELDALVPADQLPNVQIGAPVRIASSNNSRVNLQGTVREIAPLVNDQTRQATVKIDLPPSDQLRPGLFLQAAIATGAKPGLTVPTKAVLTQPDGSSKVFILSGNQAQAKSVQVGSIQPGSDPANAQVAITSGLEAGDRMIVSGVGYLKDGSAVTVAKETP